MEPPQLETVLLAWMLLKLDWKEDSEARTLERWIWKGTTGMRCWLLTLAWQSWVKMLEARYLLLSIQETPWSKALTDGVLMVNLYLRHLLPVLHLLPSPVIGFHPKVRSNWSSRIRT